MSDLILFKSFLSLKVLNRISIEINVIDVKDFKAFE